MISQDRIGIVTELPPGKKIVGSKLVFKKKTEADGTVERYKARLVAQGYTQSYGIDIMMKFSARW